MRASEPYSWIYRHGKVHESWTSSTALSDPLGNDIEEEQDREKKAYGLRLRFHTIHNSRIQIVGKYQSRMDAHQLSEVGRVDQVKTGFGCTKYSMHVYRGLASKHGEATRKRKSETLPSPTVLYCSCARLGTPRA